MSHHLLLGRRVQPHLATRSCQGVAERSLDREGQGAQRSPKSRKCPSRNPSEGAPLSRKGNPSPNLCLKEMEGSQEDPCPGSHPTQGTASSQAESSTRPGSRETEPREAGKNPAAPESSGAGREGRTRGQRTALCGPSSQPFLEGHGAPGAGWGPAGPWLRHSDNTRWVGFTGQRKHNSLPREHQDPLPSWLPHTQGPPRAVGRREGGRESPRSQISRWHHAGDPKARESPPGTNPTREREQGPPQGAKVLPIPEGTSLSGESDVFLPFALLNGLQALPRPRGTQGRRSRSSREAPPHRGSRSTHRAPPRDRDATCSWPQELSGLVPGSA